MAKKSDYIHTDEDHDANLFAGLETLAHTEKSLDGWSEKTREEDESFLGWSVQNFRMDVDCWGTRLA